MIITIREIREPRGCLVGWLVSDDGDDDDDKDYADALASELEDGEMVEAGDASWRGEPYPIDSAIKKLEELEATK